MFAKKIKLVTLILVEFEEDLAPVLQFMRKGEKNREDFQVIALSAEAMNVLDRHTIPYGLPTAIDQNELLNAVAYENLKRVDTLAQWVESHISDMAAFTPFQGFSPIRCHINEMVSLLSALAFTCARLEWLVKTYRPNRVCYCWNDDASSSLLFEPGESVWTMVCRCLRLESLSKQPQWIRHVAWCELKTRASRKKIQARIRRSNVTASFWQILKGGLDWFPRKTRAFRERMSTEIPAEILQETSRKRILFLDLNPDLAHVKNKLEQVADLELWWWSHGSSRPFLENRSFKLRKKDSIKPELFKDLWQKFIEDTDIHGLLSWNQINTFEASKEKWKLFFGRKMEQSCLEYIRARHYLMVLSPHLVVHEEVGAVWKRVITEAAQSLGIPTVFYQKGGNFGYVIQPCLELMDLHFDYMLTYTKGGAKHLSEQVEKSPWAYAQVKPAGSPYLACLKSRLDHQKLNDGINPSQLSGKTSKRHMMYVSSALHGSLRYGPDHSLDDTLYHDIQRRTLKILAAESEARVSLKIYPDRKSAYDPIEDWIHRNRFSLDVIRAPLEYVLHLADVWIFDGTATVLQQIMQTDKPIIYIMTGDVKFYPEAFEDFGKCVQVLDPWDQNFEANLHQAIKNANSSRTTSNSEFLRKFILEDDEPESVVKNAAEVLLELLGSKGRLSIGSGKLEVEHEAKTVYAQSRY